MAKRERGSVLMLMPAAVLILVILGAIAVDSAVVFLAERELANATAAAANDAAAAAVSDAAFYGSGEVVIDENEARHVAADALRLRLPEGGPVGAISLSGDPEVLVSGRHVCVTARATVRHIFARAIPGVAREAHVSARSTATAAGDGGTSVAARTIC